MVFLETDSRGNAPHTQTAAWGCCGPPSDGLTVIGRFSTTTTGATSYRSPAAPNSDSLAAVD